jgi:hypothetical protein
MQSPRFRYSQRVVSHSNKAFPIAEWLNCSTAKVLNVFFDADVR